MMDSPIVIGVDEVGRGPLAGPVVAAACIVPAGEWPWACEIKDSKKLSAKMREQLAALIEAHWPVAVAEASVAEIDTMNIRNATFLAMRRAVEKLGVNGRVIVDGNAVIPGLSLPQEALVKADDRVQAVAAASIVAKVARDRLMAALDMAHPGYGWAGNAGYGTAMHMQALQRLGVTVHHRASFAPVKDVLEKASHEHAA